VRQLSYIRGPLVLAVLLLFFASTHLQAQGRGRIACGRAFLDDSVAPARFKNGAYDDSTVYLIPTVVHVVWDSLRPADYAELGVGPRVIPRDAPNVSDSLIHAQIRVLNEDFRRFGNGFNEHPVGADVKIQFALAQRGPDGQAHDGITRTYAPELARVFIEDELKTKEPTQWDPERYFNIWVVTDIQPGSAREPGGVGNPLIIGGYAYFPQNQAGTARDGVVSLWNVFGRGEGFREAANVLGRTTTHETGHYFGLLHPWGPNEDSGCREDDGLDDTPNCNGFDVILQYPNDTATCPPEDLIQCGQRRMWENYMDYTADPCMNIFTQQQRRLMRVNLERFRAPMVSQENLIQTGLYDAYRKTIEASNRANAVEIYPLPPQNRRMTVYTSLREPAELTLDIFTILGQRVRRQQFGAAEVNKIEFSLQGLSPGLYLYRLEDRGKAVEKGKFYLR
jgi:hypothetical protein